MLGSFEILSLMEELFHGYRLCKIAGAVNVASAKLSRLIGNKLNCGNSGKEGGGY